MRRKIWMLGTGVFFAALAVSSQPELAAGDGNQCFHWHPKWHEDGSLTCLTRGIDCLGYCIIIAE